MGRLFYTLLLVSFLATAIASAGDRSDDYQNCVKQCTFTLCKTPTALPLSLRMTRWTCMDDCKYTCMHDITTNYIASGRRVQQYHGKWPFWRFAGMQEPASVAFSLLNLWSHIRGFTKMRRQIPDGHPMKPFYLIWCLASMNTWIWSSVFHTRGEQLRLLLWPASSFLEIQTTPPPKSWIISQLP